MKNIDRVYGGNSKRNMRKTVCILFFFSLICILSLSAVSAANHAVNGSDFQSIQNTIDSSGSGDTVLLGSNTYTSAGDGIEIDGKNITIQGQSNGNRANLDGRGLYRTLIVRENTTVTLRYIDFINGTSIDYHTLNIRGSLVIENCSFSNCYGDSGAAIYIFEESPTTIIKDCTFINNHAANTGNNSYAVGGAITSHGSSNLKIINCYFENNTALTYGGAIGLRNNAIGVEISNCTFLNNSAPNGGAICVLASATISNSTFKNNKATDHGGAIYVTGLNRLNIFNSKFESNGAKNGGAIYTNSSLILNGSNFKNNSAASGGGIFSNNTLTLYSTSGNNNNATTGSGGFIYGTGTININGGTFSNNNAKSNGGAVYGTGLINVKSSAKFNSNTAANGGAIFSTNNLNITSSSNFTSNRATGNGSAVYASKLTVDKGIFSSNVASSNGGAIYAKASVTLTSTSGTNNKATSGNGGFIYGIGIININGGTFSTNTAKSNGGAVYGTGTINVKTSAKFNSNSATNGGAIFSTNNLNIVSSNFNSNKATSGGAVYSSTLTVDKGVFSSNNASSNGGAVYSKGITTVKNKSVFNKNTGGNGGAIYSLNTLSIASSTLSSNVAKSNGGAIYTNKKLSITSSTLNSNKATNGGAVFSSAGLTINKGNFSKNQASSKGGSVYTTGTTTIKGASNAKSKFTSNSAKNGAAIYSNKNTVKITNTTFTNNDACIGLSLSLVDNVVKYGKTKLKVKLTGKYGNNIIVGKNDVPIWSNKITNVKINGKKATKYSLPKNSKFTIKVNGKSVTLKPTKSTNVEISTSPTYNWKNFTFTAICNGKGVVNKTTTTLKVSAKIVNTDVYNKDKIKSSNRYYPYRKDKLQTKYSSGKIYTKIIGQYTSDDAYLLGTEKVSSEYQKYLVNHKFVADVNNTLIKNQIINILKQKKNKVSGLITQEKKGKALFYWVRDNTKYESYGNTKYGAVGTLKNILNKKKEHANCADHTNLLVAMFRTVGIPIYYESWLVYKDRLDSGHAIARAYVNGNWLRLDATWKGSSWGKTEWKQSGGYLRGTYILYTKTYVKSGESFSDADF